MVKKVVKISIMLIMIVLSTSAFAQTWTTDDQTNTGTPVIKGSTYSYRVDLHGTNTYVWTVRKRSDDSVEKTITPVNGGGYSVAEVLWDIDAGEYYVQVIEKNVDNGGCETTKQFDVDVVVNSSSIIWGPIPPAFCSGEPSDFTVTLTLENAQLPWSVEYSITDEAGTVHSGTASSPADKSSNVVTISITGFVINRGQLDYTSTFTISNAKDNYSLVPNNWSTIEKTKTITIHRNPDTSDINHD